MKRYILAMLITASLLISPVVAADENMDIPANAQNTGSHDVLVEALTQAGLVYALQQEGPYTVFAPTDDAFAAAGIDLTTFDTDEENSTLSDILLYHVVLGSVTASDVTDGMTAQTLNGANLTFSVTNNSVMVNDANVSASDVMASNGVIHVIDKVLMPPAGITEADGDICYNTYAHTIAAHASFDECMSYVYLVDFELNGQTFTGCYNMVTHAGRDYVKQEECEAYMWTPAVDIATTAQATTIHHYRDLTALVAALSQAELVATLQGDGPFTVFAPSDQAFAEAGIDLAALDNEEGKALLTDILLYHVVSGAVPASAVTDGMTATAVNEDDLSFSVAEGVMVNDANVILADIPASNGVIHVIDRVLTPPADEPVVPEGCDYVVGIDESGFAFDNTDLSVAVGETVCWIWTDESMAHNVAEIDSEGDTSRKMGGAYSGPAETTVDYRITFDEDGTFHYICEPHVSMDMVGVVTVGTGVAPPPPSAQPEPSESVPGFLGITVLVAMLGAALVAGRRNL